MDRIKPTVAIIIVSYNTSNLLHDCLESLRVSTLPQHIQVIDNASTDDSVAMVQRSFPEAQICCLEQNRGFAAATNVGLRQLGFDTTPGRTVPQSVPEFVLLLNPDTIIHPGAIEALVAFLRDHPRIGLVSPRLLNLDGSVQSAAFRFPTLTMSILDVFPPGEALPGRLYNSWWHGRYPQEQQSTAPFPIDHPLGACMLVRSSTIAQVGLLDERYFMYSEEVEWCWRIRRAGWAIWQVPQAHVVHVGGAAARLFRWPMFVALHRSRVRFFHQHYSPAFLHAHRLVTRLGMLRATLISWCNYAHRRINRNELRARLWAYAVVMRL